MRLLNTRTGMFIRVQDHRRERYAILSHVWAKRSSPDYVSEQTYQDLLQLQKCASDDGTLPISNFSDKLQRFCEIALKDGFELGWADTCCIDKSDSSELATAIESMYNWYAYSGACYAFLHDVKSPREDPNWLVTFKRSEWFVRGWTLQELIASRVVIFVCEAPGQGGKWEVLGSKHNLASCISSVTNIDIGVLTSKTSLEDIPIARRMTWARSRTTTLPEDEAYCLIGIFGVKMRAKYGEGRYAFLRLQKKILSQSHDQTIFAWGRCIHQSPLMSLASVIPSPSESVSMAPDLSDDHVTLPPSVLEQYLLATSPRDFDPSCCADLVSLSRDRFQGLFSIPTTSEGLYPFAEFTPYGIRMHFPLLNLRHSSDHRFISATHCAVLACEDQGEGRGLLALFLRRRNPIGNEFFAGGIMQPILMEEPLRHASVCDRICRLMYITPEDLDSLRLRGPFASVPSPTITFIPHFPPPSVLELNYHNGIHAILGRETPNYERFEVVLCGWSRSLLESCGYHVFLARSGGTQDDLAKPFAGSEFILNQTPSFGRVQNAVTISNIQSGVHLVIQVGRCSCEFGTRRGFLGILVSSWRPDTLDTKFAASSDHSIDHPLHVRSWSFDHGAALRHMEFSSPNDPTQMFSLRLTLTCLTPAGPRRRLGEQAPVWKYQLGIELSVEQVSLEPVEYSRQPLLLNPTPWPSARRRSNSFPWQISQPIAPPHDLKEPEHEIRTGSLVLRHPRQRLPLSAPSSRPRSKSSPPQPSLAPPVTPSPGRGPRAPPAREPSDATRDGGRDLVIKYVQQAGPMILGGLVAFALISLNRYVAR